MAEKSEIKKGRYVTFNREKVANHPLYQKFIGAKWQVTRVKGERVSIGDVSFPKSVLQVIRVK